MFGDHKNHSVCRIDEAAKILRKEMDVAAREGNQFIFHFYK